MERIELPNRAILIVEEDGPSMLPGQRHAAVADLVAALNAMPPGVRLAVLDDPTRRTCEQLTADRDAAIARAEEAERSYERTIRAEYDKREALDEELARVMPIVEAARRINSMLCDSVMACPPELFDDAVLLRESIDAVDAIAQPETRGEAVTSAQDAQSRATRYALRLRECERRGAEAMAAAIREECGSGLDGRVDRALGKARGGKP